MRSRVPLHAGRLLGVLLLASACATPIGVVRGDTQTVYQSITRNVLSVGKPSAATDQILQRLGLAGRFEDEPEATLAPTDTVPARCPPLLVARGAEHTDGCFAQGRAHTQVLPEPAPIAPVPGGRR